ncbi:MAG: carbamate kinase [Acidimicrobiales bacterium]|nr:carbamate kinase [Acidimicrobiales bacterium]
MRIVVALGGNALLRRGEAMTADNQRHNVRVACEALAPLARAHQLVVSHGNGPQVGLLALQGAAYGEVETYPLDVLDAQTEGMIGYLIEQELGNLLPSGAELATILTMVEVDPADPAFGDPGKPIGPVYTREQADRLVAERGWAVKPDGSGFRRVVPSPLPQRIFELRPVLWLLERGCVVICAGGGGIPTRREEGSSGPAGRRLTGVEAVIDKDRASALLARDLAADVFVMATDVDGVYEGWGGPGARRIRRAHPGSLDPSAFAAGSMGPKVEAAVDFASRTGGLAGIGSLADVAAIVRGEAGTVVTTAAIGIEWA